MREPNVQSRCRTYNSPIPFGLRATRGCCAWAATDGGENRGSLCPQCFSIHIFTILCTVQYIDTHVTSHGINLCTFHLPTKTQLARQCSVAGMDLTCSGCTWQRDTHTAHSRVLCGSSYSGQRKAYSYTLQEVFEGQRSVRFACRHSCPTGMGLPLSEGALLRRPHGQGSTA